MASWKKHSKRTSSCQLPMTIWLPTEWAENQFIAIRTLITKKTMIEISVILVSASYYSSTVYTVGNCSF